MVLGKETAWDHRKLLILKKSCNVHLYIYIYIEHGVSFVGLCNLQVIVM